MFNRWGGHGETSLFRGRFSSSKKRVAFCGSLACLAEKLRSHIIIFVIGGPGCGKGPCCARLATKYNFYHVAVGELLREEVKKATCNSKAIKDIMLRGALVPAGYILNLLMDNMLKTENVKGFFIDGFPREISQARLFEEVVGRSPNIVIVFDCSTETMIQRLLLRSHTGTRADDHDRIIRQRLETHYTLSEPVFTYYLQKNLLRNRYWISIHLFYCRLARLLSEEKSWERNLQKLSLPNAAALLTMS